MLFSMQLKAVDSDEPVPDLCKSEESINAAFDKQTAKLKYLTLVVTPAINSLVQLLIAVFITLWFSAWL